MSFDWDIQHFPTVDAFRQYLATLARPPWCGGLTLHHTVKPTVAEWRGRESMEMLGRYYRTQVTNPDGTRGWPSGPQLFIANDGIWQGTPIDHIGVHAGVCNANRIGIEVVGNYDQQVWAEPIRSLVLGSLVSLCNWLTIPPSQINGHRNCRSTKTCPGTAIDLAVVRREVIARMNQPAPADLRVIGVGDTEQSVSLAQFGRACERNKVDLSGSEIGRVYRLGCELNIDLGVLLAMAKHEGDFGRSPLQRITNNPLNIRAVPGDPRKMAYRDDLGNWWYRFESWMLGLLWGMLYLKNEYGGFRQLHTIREIIPVFAPASDGNVPERYIAAVLEDVAYMRAH